MTLLVVTLISGACSGGSGPPAQAWSVASIAPIGQPVAAGEMVVVYGTEGEQLYLYGVAVSDGTVRWRQAASPSTVVNGIPVTPAVIGGRVAYFRPDPSKNLAARLVISAPETGEDLLVSDPTLFRSYPAGCSGSEDVCVQMEDTGGAWVSRRFSVEAGGMVPESGGERSGLPPPGARFLGEDLLDLREGVLGGFRDGEVRWRSPLTAHFSSGYTSDHGWNFELYKSAGLHVGSVGHPRALNDDSVTVTDLSWAQTVGIEASTGAHAWRSNGTSFACESKIDIPRPPANGRSEPWPVRCRSQGLVRYDKASKTLAYEGLDVAVEGFDVRTGRTTWSRSLGPAEAFMADEGRATPVGDSEVLVAAATGPMIIDLEDGSTRVPATDEAFWCGKGVLFDYREPLLLGDGRSSNERRGGTLLSRCLADGSPTTAIPKELPRSLGATVGDRTILATPDRLVAYDRR